MGIISLGLAWLIVLLMAGLTGVIWCFIIIRKSMESEDWERVDCVVLLSRFENHSSGGFPKYRVVIEYKYSVGGVTYTGDKVRWIRSFMSKHAAHNVQRKYAMGTKATVSIDPTDPGRAVLIPSIPPAIYFDLFVFGLLVALSLAAIIDK